MSKLLAMMMNKKYTRLEYIESTGTQWINTGITASQDLRVKTKIYSKSTNNQSVFCSRSSQGSNNFALLLVNGYFRPCYDTEYSNSNKTFSINTLYDIDFNKNNFYVDGELIKTFTYNTFSNDVSMKIANSINAGEIYYIGRIYPIQIYKNDILVCDLIPVICNSDNEIGMLDRVSGIFRTNRGTGKFRVPNEVGYTVVGSPTIVDDVVSGFGSDNYLQIQKQIFNMQDRIEIVCKFRYSANTNNAYIMSWQTNNLQRGFYLSDTGKIRVYWSNTSVAGTELRVFGNYTFNSDTDNYVKITKERNTLYLYYSTDGITYTLDNSATNDTLGTVTFGPYIRFGLNYNLSSGNVFSGQIDLNETYIKTNNKLWFNGQPA